MGTGSADTWPDGSCYRLHRGMPRLLAWIGWIGCIAGVAFIAWSAWSLGAWSGAFMTAFAILAAAWYGCYAGMQALRSVEFTVGGLVLHYAFRKAVLDKAEIAGAEIVGPEAFGPAARLFLGMRGSRSPAYCRSPQLGAVDLFGRLGPQMVAVRLVNHRPIVLDLERPAEFVAELAKLITPQLAPGPAGPRRSALDRGRWIVFAAPAIFVALCLCFGLSWLIYAELGSSPLHRAAWSGNVAQVKRLAAERPDLLEKPDRRGYRPLHVAVDRSPAVVAALLDEGADIEGRSDLGDTPLQHSVLPRANPGSLDLLLARGADVRTRNNMGRTPLHTSAIYRNVRAARALLTHGADVNTRDNDGWSPLGLARSRKGGPTPDQQAMYDLIREHGGKE